MLKLEMFSLEMFNKIAFMVVVDMLTLFTKDIRLTGYILQCYYYNRDLLSEK